MTCLSATHSTGLWCNANWIQSGRVGYRPLIWIRLSQVNGIGTDASDVLSLSSVYLELCWLQLQSLFQGLKDFIFYVKFEKGLPRSFCLNWCTCWLHGSVVSNHTCTPKYIISELDNLKLSRHNRRKDKSQPKKEVDNSEKWNLRKCTYWFLNYHLCFEMRIELPSCYGILSKIITRNN